MPVASRDIYTDISEGLFLLQLPHESQLMASAVSSSSLTQPNVNFVSRLVLGNNTGSRS